LSVEVTAQGWQVKEKPAAAHVFLEAGVGEPGLSRLAGWVWLVYGGGVANPVLFWSPDHGQAPTTNAA